MRYADELALAEHIESLGGKLYLVGGAVRDDILGIPPKDRDYLITGVRIEDIPFEKVVGNKFPVFLVSIADEVCQVAIARTERKNGVGHKGFEFYCSPETTVEEDLERRDLTINAIALDVRTGEYHSPFDGLYDLEMGIIRHTSAAFTEDPLRVLRVARFAARYGFEVASETIYLMNKMRHELHTLPGERIWGELCEVLVGPHPEIFFRVLKDAGVLGDVFPEIRALEVPDRHDGTAFEHTMKAIACASTPMERFGCLVHDFGKGLTDPEMHPRHHRHDELGVPVVKAFCARLRVPNEYRDFGIICAREHMRMQKILQMRPGKAFKLLRSLGDDSSLLNRVVYLENISSDASDINNVIRQYCKTEDLIEIASEAHDSISGGDLIERGMTPGPKIGEVLFQKRVEAFIQYRET